MKCKSTTEHLTQYLLGDLSPEITEEIRLHLQDCGDCRAEAEEIESTLGILREALAEPSDAPAKLESSHYDKIYSAGSRDEQLESPRRKAVALQAVDWFTSSHRNIALAASLFVMVGFLGLLVKFAGRDSVSPLMSDEMDAVVIEPAPTEELGESVEIAMDEIAPTELKANLDSSAKMLKGDIEYNQLMPQSDAMMEVQSAKSEAKAVIPKMRSEISRKESRTRSDAPTVSPAKQKVPKPATDKMTVSRASAPDQAVHFAWPIGDDEGIGGVVNMQDKDAEAAIKPVSAGGAIIAGKPAGRLADFERPAAQNVKKRGLKGRKPKPTGANAFVDTDSYALTRTYIKKGVLPAAGSVKTEQFVNAFDYGYATIAKDVFKVYAETAPSRYGDGMHMLKLGVKGKAKQVLSQELSAAVDTIAADVKINVEFMPRFVERYRLLGYDNRQRSKEQFKDNAIVIGEVGSAQAVTVLYELKLGARPQLLSDLTQVMAVARVSYRRLDTGALEEIEQRVSMDDIVPGFEKASSRFKLAAGVAEFAEILRGTPYAKGSQFGDVIKVLRPIAHEYNQDKNIVELLDMVEKAARINKR